METKLPTRVQISLFPLGRRRLFLLSLTRLSESEQQEP